MTKHHALLSMHTGGTKDASELKDLCKSYFDSQLHLKFVEENMVTVF